MTERERVVQNRKKVEHYSFLLDKTLYSGKSKVYRGEDDDTRRPVAVKAVLIKSLQTDESKALLNNELQILKSLKHPNVVACLDIYTTFNNVYLIMECLDGDYSMPAFRKDLTPAKVLAVFADLARVLAHFEVRGLLHRAINPTNIGVKAGQPKLLDFGRARLIQDPEIEQPAVSKQDPFHAPEVRQSKEFSFKSDVWSLGVFALYLLLQPSSEAEFMSRIYKRNFRLDLNNPVADELITRMTSPRPELRPMASEIVQKLFSSQPARSLPVEVQRVEVQRVEQQDLTSAKAAQAHLQFAQYCRRVAYLLKEESQQQLLFMVYKLIVIQLANLTKFLDQSKNVLGANDYADWAAGKAIRKKLERVEEVDKESTAEELRLFFPEYRASLLSEIEGSKHKFVKLASAGGVYFRDMQEKEGFYVAVIEAAREQIKQLQGVLNESKSPLTLKQQELVVSCDHVLTLMLVLGEVVSQSTCTRALAKIDFRTILQSFCPAHVVPFEAVRLLRDKVKRLID